MTQAGASFAFGKFGKQLTSEIPMRTDTLASDAAARFGDVFGTPDDPITHVQQRAGRRTATKPLRPVRSRPWGRHDR